jgi:hypothetical protein
MNKKRKQKRFKKRAALPPPTTLEEVRQAAVLGANASIGACELCGAKDGELRPYGPNGENICFDCGMKDKDATERQMGKALNFNNERNSDTERR